MNCEKRILFVGAGQQQTSAIMQAKSKGYKCFAIDGDEKARGVDVVDRYAIGDITDPTFIVSCALMFKVDAIVVISTDAPLVAAAEACETLGLCFVDVSAAKISVNKLLQRELMKEAGLTIPRFEKFHDFDSFNYGISKVGLPAVVKPIDGSGSRGVMLVHQNDDLTVAMRHALNNSRLGLGLIETFVEGSEIAVDGFVINGKLHVITISDKLRTSGYHLLDTEVIFPAKLTSSSEKNIKKIVQKVVSKFGLDNCPIHIEMIKSSDGPMIVEVAARGAGSNIFTDILPYVSGVDTVSTQLKLALGNDDLEVKISRNYSSIISFIHEKPGIVKSIEGIKETALIPGVKDISLYVGVGDTIRELKSGSDRIGHILICTDNRKKSEAVLERAKHTIKVISVNEK